MTTPELQAIYPEWEIVRPLGEGAFGKVYEIRRDGDGLEEHAALKVIHIPAHPSEAQALRSEGADDASISAHFRELTGQLSNEIATQAKLKGNSNIVSYEDRKIVPDADGMGYTILIRMELLTSLLDHMAAQPMGLDDVLRLGIDMARALLLCEKHRIVHRDIKPQNIFISPNGDYKLGDFGVAREMEKSTMNLSRKGTYNYMAPEVFHGQPGKATVDIYSLGIVLYTLLNGGRAPFLAPPPAELPSTRERELAQTKRLGGEPLPPLSGQPAALNELILKMCAFDPKARYQNARELAEAMESVAYELRADKTVCLFSWIGANTPDVVPPDAITEGEGSRWIDGTPVVKPEPELPLPVSAPEPLPPPAQAKKKLLAILAGALAFVALVGLAVWASTQNSGITVGTPTTKETTMIENANPTIMEYSGHRYWVVQAARSYEDAIAFCEGMGGHLLTINSAAEQEFILSLLPDFDSSAYWLFATLSGDKWHWGTDEQFEYTNFLPGEPSDNGEAFLILTNAYSGGTWGWNNCTAEDDDRYCFVIEFEPESATSTAQPTTTKPTTTTTQEPTTTKQATTVAPSTSKKSATTTARVTTYRTAKTNGSIDWAKSYTDVIKALIKDTRRSSSDFSFILYDFDGNGIPEMILIEAGYLSYFYDSVYNGYLGSKVFSRTDATYYRHNGSDNQFGFFIAENGNFFVESYSGGGKTPRIANIIKNELSESEYKRRVDEFRRNFTEFESTYYIDGMNIEDYWIR
jgi:serine/threonine protein kinase